MVRRQHSAQQLQLFAWAQNITNARATNRRSYSLVAPIGGFGGVRVSF